MRFLKASSISQPLVISEDIAIHNTDGDIIVGAPITIEKEITLLFMAKNFYALKDIDGPTANIRFYMEEKAVFASSVDSLNLEVICNSLIFNPGRRKLLQEIKDFDKSSLKPIANRSNNQGEAVKKSAETVKEEDQSAETQSKKRRRVA